MKPQQAPELLTYFAERLQLATDPAAGAATGPTTGPATGPAAAAHCARAGERLICVAQRKLKACRQGLGKLSLVLPEDAHV
jgi:hypothetical protein